MKKSIIVAVTAAWALSGSAFAATGCGAGNTPADPDPAVLPANGMMTTVAQASASGVSSQAIQEGIERAMQYATFSKGILDRDIVRAIDAGKCAHLELLATHASMTTCRGGSLSEGAEQHLVHVPGYAQPRCLIFTI